MGKVKKTTIQGLGYGLVDQQYLQPGETEYSRRLQQAVEGREYRQLTAAEIKLLVEYGNYSPDWQEVWVTDSFLPQLIRNSRFFGLVRIGDMSLSMLEYQDLKLPVGIYDSEVLSCDIGNDVAIHKVSYLAHFILGNEVILSANKEMITSGKAKFGNGVLKQGESEEQRIVLELCNENGNRSVVPFDGMQASDAYLWTRYRDDQQLQDRFLQMTEQRFDNARGYYSEIGDSTVIKNCKTLKDVKIGSHAYIKGVNKLKNVTVNSREDAATQIGEGCELVNGIIGFGCRVFYGVKAVRFVLSSFSQLKYGARLINSFLGDNSTISCCEVLNTLIFPAHEQHHNNSFLCAALVKGQSNMAAGATVGSNHNSRGADGEIIAERGFWPGLCVSLKHNSRFASYALIVKGDFLYELDIKLPFTLVSLDVKNDQLVLIPGYWFLYNAYALMRNTDKFAARDNRKLKNQYFEYDVLAPDTVNEMLDGMGEIELAIGRCGYQGTDTMTDAAYRAWGREWLLNPDRQPIQEVTIEGVECSKRKVILAKPLEAYKVYRRMIAYYVGVEVLAFLSAAGEDDLALLLQDVEVGDRPRFDNVGGQLIEVRQLESLLEQIKTEEISSWDEVHTWYHQASASYPIMRLKHAMVVYAELIGDVPWEHDLTNDWLGELIEQTYETKKWLYQQILDSRSKDYTNPFRNMVYRSDEERDQVVGALKDNSFIKKQQQELVQMARQIDKLQKKHTKING